MALSWLIRMAGKFEGLTDQQLDQIEAAMPATKNLIALSIKAKPILEKLQPIYNEARPLIDQAKPLVAKAMPLIEEIKPIADEAMPLVDQAQKEWEKLAPVVLMLIEKFANKKPVHSSDLADSGYPWT